MNAAVDRLVGRVGHWEPPRWTAPTTPDGGEPSTRADLIFGLVQWLADLAADAEGVVRRPVPRPANDPVLPDQVRVMVADLLFSDPPADVLSAAAARVDATARQL